MLLAQPWEAIHTVALGAQVQEGMPFPMASATQCPLSHTLSHSPLPCVPVIHSPMLLHLHCVMRIHTHTQQLRHLACACSPAYCQ